jgi:hypothetical protein
MSSRRDYGVVYYKDARMARPISRLTLAVVAIASAFIPGSASAQMGYQANSLEWLIADSDVVARASVSKVERVPIPNPNPKMYEEPRDRITVTLKVHETLKGVQADSLEFTEEILGYFRVYDGWKQAGREQLWFLVRDTEREGDAEPEAGIAPRLRLKPYGGGWSVVRLGPAVPEERGFTKMPPPIFSMDLTVREKPDDILEAARAAAAQGVKRGKVEGHNLDLPRGVMQRSGKSGDANSLTVPVDRRLETLAHRLIKSPRDILDGPEQAWANYIRLEGIKALRHFASEKNAALLKPLLEDPSWSTHDGPGPKREKVYDVREAAYETLQAWGIVVDKPVLREAAPES